MSTPESPDSPGLASRVWPEVAFVIGWIIMEIGWIMEAHPGPRFLVGSGVLLIGVLCALAGGWGVRRRAKKKDPPPSPRTLEFWVRIACALLVAFLAGTHLLAA